MNIFVFLNASSKQSLHERKKAGTTSPFDLDILREAFSLRKTTPVKLPSVSHFLHTCLLSLVRVFVWYFKFCDISHFCMVLIGREGDPYLSSEVKK